MDGDIVGAEIYNTAAYIERKIAREESLPIDAAFSLKDNGEIAEQDRRVAGRKVSGE